MLYERKENNGAITFEPLAMLPSESAIAIVADYEFICRHLSPTRAHVAVELLHLVALKRVERKQ